MRCVAFLTLLTGLLISCDALPQSPEETGEGSDVENTSDRPTDLNLPAGDRPVPSSPGDTEEAEPDPNLQAVDAGDVFADRAEVVVVYSFLTDTFLPEIFYAAQFFSVIIDEYKGERPVRRSDCKSVAFGHYRSKGVRIQRVSIVAWTGSLSFLVFLFVFCL